MPKTTKIPLKPSKCVSLKERYDELNNAKKTQFRKNMVTNCGKSEPTVYRWIQGETPTLLEQKEIANFFGVESAEIFD